MKTIKSFVISIITFLVFILCLTINAQSKIEFIPTQQELLNKDSLLLWSEISLLGDITACNKLKQAKKLWYKQEEYWAVTDPLFYDQMKMVYENLDCHCGIIE